MGTRSDAQGYFLREIEKKYADKIELVYPKDCVHRMFHDFARNEAVKDFLASDCDILWFLDSDVVPPTDVLDLVTKYGQHWELAGAPYPVFMSVEGYPGQQVVFTVYTRDEGGLHASKLPNSGTAFVDGLATGCLFIKREVFSELQEPYFEFKYNEKSRQMVEGEDLGFCMKVNALGHKFFVDYALVCKHYKTVDLLSVNNYAIEFTNTALRAYEREVKPKVIELANEVERLRKGRSTSGLILPT